MFETIHKKERRILKCFSKFFVGFDIFILNFSNNFQIVLSVWSGWNMFRIFRRNIVWVYDPVDAVAAGNVNDPDAL